MRRQGLSQLFYPSFETVNAISRACCTVCMLNSHASQLKQCLTSRFRCARRASVKRGRVVSDLPPEKAEGPCTGIYPFPNARTLSLGFFAPIPMPWANARSFDAPICMTYSCPGAAQAPARLHVSREPVSPQPRVKRRLARECGISSLFRVPAYDIAAISDAVTSKYRGPIDEKGSVLARINASHPHASCSVSPSIVNAL